MGERSEYDLWLRKVFSLKGKVENPSLFVRFSGNVEIWINNEQVYTNDKTPEDYLTIPLKGINLRKGNNTIAVHLKKDSGLSYYDLGIIEI